MDTNNTLMEIFSNRLSDYITFLDAKMAEYEIVYNARSYLMNNYRYQSIPIVEAISSIPLDNVYELLTTFESNPLYSKTDIDNALKFCKACEKNPKFKEHERYKELYAVLDYVHKLFTSHIFSNHNEVNLERINEAKKRSKKFKDLQLFIKGELPEYELEALDTYRFDKANLSDAEWIEVYFNLTTMQIEAYKRREEILREEISTREEQRRTAIAEALERKIRESIPKEDAEVLQSAGTLGIEEDTEVEEVLSPEPVVVLPNDTMNSGKSLLNNGEVKRIYELLQEKYRAYKVFGKITPTKRESFKLNYDGFDTEKSLEYARIAYNDSDYQKFLFFCFYEKYIQILNDVQVLYTDDFEGYVEVIIDDMNQALDFILKLEKILELEDKELEQATESEQPVQGQEVEKTYKLIFYGNNGSSSEMERSLKNMTSQKVSDLSALLSRLEEGRFENVRVLKKYNKIGFKLLIGQLVFITFRTLPNNHILVYTAGALDELNNNKVDNRLAVYDMNVERRVNSAIKDGTLEYRRLMKKSDDIKALIFSEGLNKGV